MTTVRFRRLGPGLALGALLLVGACDPQADVGSSAVDVPQEESSETLERLADFTLARGDAASAIGLYRRAHLADPDRIAPLIKLGRTLARAGNHEEAAGAFNQALIDDPDNSDALRGYANAQIALGRPEVARVNLEAALDSETLPPSDRPFVLNSLGVALDLLGRHEDAQARYRDGLDLTPGDLDLRSNLALSLSLAGADTAAVDLMRTVAAAPAAEARHRRNLALVLGLAGNAEGAAEALRRADVPADEITAQVQQYARLRAIEDSTARAAAIAEARSIPAG
ncbi:MAG: tetratricopeptide repeat protein [Inquilinaceae bacterium]